MLWFYDTVSENILNVTSWVDVHVLVHLARMSYKAAKAHNAANQLNKIQVYL